MRRTFYSAPLRLALGGLLLATLGAGSAQASTAKASSAAKAKKHKAKRGHADFSGGLAAQSELRDEPAPRPTGHIVLTSINLHETIDVQIYRPDGSFDPDALDALNHAFRCRVTQTEKAIEPHLFEMLSRIYDHFGRPLELVSGFRNQERVTSFHFHGSASDIRISGVSERALHKFVTSLDSGGMGIGLYPRAGFVHVDIRPEASYRWTDYSPPGKGDSVARGSFINRRHKKHTRNNT